MNRFAEFFPTVKKSMGEDGFDLMTIASAKETEVGSGRAAVFNSSTL